MSLPLPTNFAFITVYHVYIAGTYIKLFVKLFWCCINENCFIFINS